MARVTSSVARNKRKKKILKAAPSGPACRWPRSTRTRATSCCAWSWSCRDRRRKKRDFRRLWIARINAATRQHDISYSRFMHGLKVAGVEVNRKVLADLAVREPEAFAELARVAKEHAG